MQFLFHSNATGSETLKKFLTQSLIRAKTPVMLKTLIAFLLIFTQLSAFAGDMVGNGDWGHAQGILNEACTELSIELEEVTSGYFKLLLESKKVDPDWPGQRIYIDKQHVTLELLATVIKNVRNGHTESDEGRYLTWGSEVVETFTSGNELTLRTVLYIKALDNFYVTFGKFRKAVDPENYRKEKAEIKFRLIKEAAHLWGFNDDQGDLLAEKLLDFIACKKSDNKDSCSN